MFRKITLVEENLIRKPDCRLTRITALPAGLRKMTKKERELADEQLVFNNGIVGVIKEPREETGCGREGGLRKCSCRASANVISNMFVGNCSAERVR